MKKHLLTRHLRPGLASLLLSCAVTALSAQSTDNSFGSGGIVTTPNTSEIMALATQPDGKIVAAGYRLFNMNSNFQIARYRADGTPDPTFGSSGMVQTTISFGATPTCVTIQPDGKILVGGTYTTGDFAPFSHSVLVRYNSDGSPDNGFGESGVVQREISLSESLNAIALQPDGKIITGGELFDGTNNRFLLMKYNANGSPDAGFGSAGVIITAIGDYAGIADIALLPDGTILAAGTEGISSVIPEGSEEQRFALAKYNNNGTAYNLFGTNGIVLTDLIPEVADRISNIAIQADGKIVAGGSSGHWQAIARYLPDGTLDAAFGTAGKTITDERPSVTDLVIRNDGRIVSSGSLLAADFGADFVLMQYNANGSLDHDFGADGSFITSIAPSGPEGSRDYMQCLALQADGKLLAGGSANDRFALVRYNLSSDPTGIETPAADQLFKVHPNPFRDILILDQEQIRRQQISELQLVNVLGQTVFRTAITPQQGSYNIPRNLVGGNYMLLLQQKGEKTWKTKLTKQ